MRLRWLDALILGYGILLIVMGIVGYLHGSVISLVTGGISGVLEIGFAALTTTNPRVGRIGSAVVALLILGSMLPESIKKGKADFIILAVASGIVFACLMGGHFYAMSRRKAADSETVPQQSDASPRIG
jgi:uncharacterized membrane protein (UPF0136 family)